VRALGDATIDIRDPGTPPIDLVVEVKVALIETGLLTLADPDEADIDHSAEEIAKVFHERIWSMQDKAESHEKLSTQAWSKVRALKRALRDAVEASNSKCVYGPECDDCWVCRAKDILDGERPVLRVTEGGGGK